MKRKKLISGNWKMYKSQSEAKSFLEALAKSSLQKAELLLFPQAPLLPLFQQEWKGSQLAWGPQNLYWEEKGAFTGELSPLLAKELGSTFALAGHSERRQFFGESNESAARRALAAHKHGMNAVFCVGEQLAERDAGKTFAVLEAQCAPLFEAAKVAPDGFTFAYEPVWAIGTGRTATAAQAQEVHAFLRGLIAKAWGKSAAESTRLLYGGSVKPENAKELMSQADIDGVLVGGASLEAASFLAIAEAGEGC